MKHQTFLGVILLLSLNISSVIAKENQSINHIEARTLKSYSAGRYKDAIQGFRRLKDHYQDKDNNLYIEYSILNAYSLDAIGVPIEACSSLDQIINANPKLCDINSIDGIGTQIQIVTRNHVITAITLANLLRDLGQFNKAQALLSEAELVARKLNDEQLIAGVEISYGNLSLVRLTLMRDRLSYRDAKIPQPERERIESTFTQTYQRYESAFKSPINREAISKWLFLHEEHRKWLPLLLSSDTYRLKAKEYHKNLNIFSKSTPTEITELEHVKSNLDLAHHLYNFGVIQTDQETLTSAFEVSRDVLAQTTNKQLRSDTFGLIGKLYSYSNQNQKAIKAFQLASEHSRNSYQWQHKQAQLYEKLGDQDNAIKFYEASIENLKDVEWNVNPTTAEIRLNFQDKTKPIYDNYLKLLLSQNEPDFEKIIRTQQQFASSELQNYLGCSSLEAISSKELFQQDQNATVIYIFKSGNYYHTIAQKPQKLEYSRSSASDIDRNLKLSRLLINSEQNSISETRLKNNLNQLYEQLLKPVASLINPEETLIFALDSNLQQVSIGMLFDGDRYLIEKNPIALITPQLFNPKKLSNSDKNSIFFGGLSKTPEKYSEFGPIPYVELEARSINANRTLINQDFTKGRLIKNLATEQSVFHIASHGQFSSDPNETFVLSWDNKITLDSLSSVVGDRAQNTPDPIELLVLSACESAKGDKGAFLGLAGITVQSGARSTVASLWQVEDESAALLMKDFYTFLRSGKSKAKSLQLAQIKQIEQGQSPNYWGGFILVGSWL